MTPFSLPDYVLADPAGNITVIVTSPVPVGNQAAVANELLQTEPAAEQVGYLSYTRGADDFSLRMSGGEFCGNATLSAAAYILSLQGKTQGSFKAAVSGAADVLKIDVIRDGESYCGTVEMPVPAGCGIREFSCDGKSFSLPLVDLGGICHIIAAGIEPDSFFEKAAAQWCSELGCDALGIMFLDDRESRITPLVYVAGIDSLYWEHSCASGTCAAVYYLSQASQEPYERYFYEPGGRIGARTEGGRVSLLGKVRIM